MARKSKPRKTPEQQAAERLKLRMQNLEAVSLPAEAAMLPNHDDVEPTRKGEVRDSERRTGKKVEEDSARRLDAFEALKESMKDAPYVGCYDAARKFERDLLVSLGQHDHGRTVDRVDCEQAAFSRVDTMLAASDKMKQVRAKLSDRDWWLLNVLVYPSAKYPTWRAAVYDITGEANWNAQGAVVRSTCVNLRDAYVGLQVAHRAAA